MALNFSAESSEELNAASVFSGSLGTFVCWARWDSFATYRTAFEWTGDYILVTDDADGDDLKIWAEHEGDFLSFGHDIALNTWYFIAIVVNGANLDMYIAAAGASSLTKHSDTDSSGAQTLVSIAIGNDVYDEAMSGDIAAVRLWAAALTQAEIEEEWRRFSPSRISNLVCNYPFLRNNDNAHLVDLSGQGNDLSGSGTTPGNADNPPIMWAPSHSPIFTPAGAGVTESVSITEGAEAGDSWAAIAQALGALLEGAKAGDIELGTAQALGALLEGAKAGDSWAATKQALGALLEGAKAGDTELGTAQALGALLEGAKAGDTELGTAAATASITEGSVAGDTPGSIAAALAAISDGGSSGDVMAAIAVALAAIAEGGKAGESWAAEVLNVADISDGGTAGDAFSGAVAGLAAIGDGAEAGDAIAAFASAIGAIAEGSKAGDAWIGTVSAAIDGIIAEASKAGETFLAAAQAVAATVDGALAGDTWSASSAQVGLVIATIRIVAAVSATVSIEAAVDGSVNTTPAVNGSIEINEGG